MAKISQYQDYQASELINPWLAFDCGWLNRRPNRTEVLPNKTLLGHSEPSQNVHKCYSRDLLSLNLVVCVP